jgi:hypothetical protein
MRSDVFLVLAFAICSCGEVDKKRSLFEQVKPSKTGITHKNSLKFDQKFNIYTYRNFYNGGGVAIGDINNDGLPDLYFTLNQEKNRLYLNKGDLRFEDITEQAGVGGSKAWSTGVSMVDINADGLIDIYVCNSGSVKGDNKENELFINNGDRTFSERASEFGLADQGYSTHAAFFDYDRDGDLDVYLLNNSYQAIGSFNLRKNERPNRDPLGGDKLLRNDNGLFVDVSEKAGIYGSVIGFGLGVTAGDVDNDGWIDLYISNDFFERDYLYMNNRDGTFREILVSAMHSISAASMGADMADINNDGWPEIFVTEMLPEDHARFKTVTTFEDWNRYQYNVLNDYYHQFTRNTLQLNNQDGSFSEIGRLAGVESTDWSWGALMVDLDNDGWRDIYVSNGIRQDLTNQDFLQFASSEEMVRSVVSKKGVNYERLVEVIPSNAISNFAFRNKGNLQFENVTRYWGLNDVSFSNGTAYGDLDVDGDLDLVVNNVDDVPWVLENRSTPKDGSYLQIELEGTGQNLHAIGAKVFAYTASGIVSAEQILTRGFQSSIDPTIHLGLGNTQVIDSLVVRWPDDRVTFLKAVQTRQRIALQQKDAVLLDVFPKLPNSKKVFLSFDSIRYAHRENNFVDFDRDRLLYHMISNEGPRACKSDVNRDGRTDIYIGGASGQPGSLLVQQGNGQFMPIAQTLLAADSTSEDCGCTFFDADGDGDQDLYVTSGGNEFSANSTALIDRLYINEGTRWRKSEQLLPTTKFESTSVVSAGDVDQDGDQDLFVGVRLQPLYYGVPVSSYVLANDGRGQFTDVTSTWAPGLQQVGMITDGHWVDLDGDRDMDLVVAGEWTAIRVFINQGDRLVDQTAEWGTLSTKGWWNRLVLKDLDGDGDLDVIGGNHGWNSRFKATEAKPVTMWVNDFDGNGTVEHIVARYWGETQYPMALRHDLVQQLPYLKKKYLKYENYKDQMVADIFGAEALQKSVRLDVQQLGSVILWNEGGRFRQEVLPVEAQISSVYGILAEDLDQDGQVDILLGGNQYRAKPEVGRYDGSYGVYLRGLGSQRFEVVPNRTSGLKLDGEIRDLVLMKVNGKRSVLALRNNANPLVVRVP